MKTLVSATLFVAWLVVAGPSRAQTPQQPQGKDTLPHPQEIPLPQAKDTLPHPHQVVPKAVPPFVIISRPEIGRRDVWEYYSVNSRGQMVPRVVMAPGGYYYLANGQPYPWAVTGSRSYMPLAVD